ncbi:spore photoproduct lyase [Lachnospiraceae bacterium KM106-2]|nr:spore photoproduct lyase [Lachnospiraceae bacterium KM106-2]
MNSYLTPSAPSNFTHIYIEKKIANDLQTKQILQKFPHASTIYIDHYKDLFNRPHQNYRLQKQHMNLILAKKEGQLLYPGAPVCQSFGETYFYYTSLMMNCIYDCEYCYLQGMYPSANLVLFINLEDYFQEIEQLLLRHPVYLCISYDTDLLALESIHGYVAKWLAFVRSHKDLTVELRTKSANFHFLDQLAPCDRFILAWTLSPDTIQIAHERKTPSLSHRIACINQALAASYPVRLCFDPMIYRSDWKAVYEKFIQDVSVQIDLSRIRDFSIGIFRIASCYLKAMQKAEPNSLIAHYPYENDHGVCHYKLELSKEMTTFLKEKLLTYTNKNNIYIWEEETK